MDDGFAPVLHNQCRHSRPVPAVTDHERRVPRHRPIEAGCEIVDTPTRSLASTRA